MTPEEGESAVPTKDVVPEILTFGPGHVVLDPLTGAPLRFVDEEHPERRFLLDTDATAWHSVEHQWGAGHLVTDRGAARWHTPAELRAADGVIEAVHTPLPGVRVEVRRSVREGLLYERYAVRNTGREPLAVTGLGIRTPFGDLYDGAERSLERAVHAHVFTGGTWAWALAQPMSGEGRCLGLTVREGALRAYSVESRNQNSGSDARGHLVLLVTDRARNPDSFGGQPVLRVPTGETLTLTWELGWYASVADFTTATRPPAVLSAYAVETGQPIVVTGAAPVSSPDPEVTVERDAEGRHRVSASRHGTRTLDLGDGARTEVLFHLPLEEVVRRRVDYIIRHQRARERPGLLAHAFVPVDTRTGLTQPTNGWPDWTDGSERIAMPQLLQTAAARGLADPEETEPLLDGWSQFARTHLLDETAAPRRGSQNWHTGPRLYDTPWLAHFFHDRHRANGRPEDLDLAARILERGFELGGAAHLSIGLSPATLAVGAALDTAGQKDRAESLRTQLIGSARQFVAMGRRLPAHEVAYEQSIVAPLLDLLVDAHTLTGDPAFLDAAAERLPWLLAFGGPQPHVRLHGIAIRHWDGYWFGAHRLWGDVFPHYWSTLTATTLLRLPPALRTPETDRLAEAILRANMANYRPDGSATCAFVLPSTVDGRPAHTADPLANDQDWHLVLWLRARERAERPPV